MEIDWVSHPGTSYYGRDTHEDLPIMNIHARAKATTKAESATVRVTFLMTPTKKEALLVKAAQEGLSVSEYLRRKIFDQEPDLDALVCAVHASNERALKVVDHVLANMAIRERNVARREAQVRAKAASEFEAWTSGQKNAVGRVLGA
jgi:hypothetical protein